MVSISPIRSSEDFQRQFVPSCPELFMGTSGQIGSELELWTVKQDAQNYDGGALPTSDMFVSGANQLLRVLQQQVGGKIFPRFVSEFSDCQVEINTRPFTDMNLLCEDIEDLIKLARRFASETFGWDLIGTGLAPDGVPRIPNPSDERYVRFAREMPEHITDIMFRVAALQFHVAAETEAELFELYNALVRALPNIRNLEGVTPSMRSRLFETGLYPSANPPELCGWDDAFVYYRSLGKLEDLKAHWAWVRLSAARVSSSGTPIKPMTVEFRLPDSTTDLNNIWRITKAIRSFC